jgi:glycine hydroxymethyltransferase
LQGGPHDNQTAAIAVALLEASSPAFKKYAAQIVSNSKALAKELNSLGFGLISGGSENHLILIDLRNKNVNGAIAALALETAGIVINKNGVPFDPMPPFYPSGIRLGTPAITTRGMKEKDMKKIAVWIDRAVKEVSLEVLPSDKAERSVYIKDFKVRVVKNKNMHELEKEVKEFTSKFPTP